MSNDIKILVLEIKITHLVFGCYLYCRFCRQSKEIFLVTMSFLFCWMRIFSHIKQLFGNTSFLELVELLMVIFWWPLRIKAVLLRHITNLAEPKKLWIDLKIWAILSIFRVSRSFWLQLRLNYYCKFNHFWSGWVTIFRNSCKLNNFKPHNALRKVLWLQRQLQK